MKSTLIILFLFCSGCLMYCQIPGTPYIPCIPIVPNTMTLAQSQKSFVTSVYDQDYLPFSIATTAASTATTAADGVAESVTIDVPCEIPASGITISIPVTPTAAGLLNPYSTRITVPAELTEDGNSRVLVFSWASQGFTTATTSITATIKVEGGALKVKKLDVNSGIGSDFLGVSLAAFSYPYNSTGTLTDFQLRATSGIPDKMYGIADNTGNSTSHMMLYMPVLGEDGNIWLNNNLGANYANVNKSSFAPTKQAQGVGDFNAYGSLFQWGRKPDGHELITWTSSTSGTGNNGTSTTKSDNPTDALVVCNTENWRVNQDSILWKTESSSNNPCPSGFRIPNISELLTLSNRISPGFVGAAECALKLLGSGFRNCETVNTVNDGVFWSNYNVSHSDRAVVFDFADNITLTASQIMAIGVSVRCIRNIPATITALNCAGVTHAGTITQGASATGVSSTISYSGGNGGAYDAQSIASTGVLGLTATLESGFVASGSGQITYTITGTPTSAGTASFAIAIGGKNCTLTRSVAANITIPATIALTTNSQMIMIASVYDNDYLPYSWSGIASVGESAADGIPDAPVIDIQGSITTTGRTVVIPVIATASGTLPAYSSIINIPASKTEDGISRNLMLSWTSQSYTTKTIMITATISAIDGTLNAKKLDINGGMGNSFRGILMGTFNYPYDNTGNLATYQVRDVSAIPDKMFNIPDNNGDRTSHNMLYVPVFAEDGNIWLSNNLGADYANLNSSNFDLNQQATNVSDYKAYGSLFQWGRNPDGHELITYTSGSNATVVNGTTTTKSDSPTNALFIRGSADWRVNVSDYLWTSDNPCPSGFYVPSQNEMVVWVASSGVTNYTEAAKSKLKFSGYFYRDYGSGSLDNGTYALHYWTNTVYDSNSCYNLGFTSGGVNTSYDRGRGYGFSVRCVAPQ